MGVPRLYSEEIGRSRPCWSRVSSCFLPDPSRSWFAIAFDCLRPRLARCPQMLGLNVPRKHTKRDWSPHSSEKHPHCKLSNRFSHGRTAYLIQLQAGCAHVGSEASPLLFPDPNAFGTKLPNARQTFRSCSLRDGAKRCG